jgi:hypothetical protein
MFISSAIKSTYSWCNGLLFPRESRRETENKFSYTEAISSFLDHQTHQLSISRLSNQQWPRFYTVLLTNRQRSYSEKLRIEKSTNANRKLFRCFQVLEANLFRSSGELDTWTTTFSRKMCPDEETNFKLFDGLGKIFLLPMYFHLPFLFLFSFCLLFTPLRLYGFDIEKRSTKERWNCSVITANALTIHSRESGEILHGNHSNVRPMKESID